MNAQHECAAPKCGKRCDYDMLMCPPHWKQLPTTIRDNVWSTWRNVRRDRQAYLDARQEAVDWHVRNGSGRQGGLFG